MNDTQTKIRMSDKLQTIIQAQATITTLEAHRGNIAAVDEATEIRDETKDCILQVFYGIRLSVSAALSALDAGEFTVTLDILQRLEYALEREL